MKKKYEVKLSDDERSELNRITTVGQAPVRQVKRCHVLLQADAGEKDQAIAAQVGLTIVTVERIRKQYVTEGLKAAINEKKRSGRPQGISAQTRATVTALACSKPPAGRSRWTLRLLADKVVELDEEATLSHQSVAEILKKTNLSLT